MVDGFEWRAFDIPLPLLFVVHRSIAHQRSGAHRLRGLGQELSTFGKIAASFRHVRTALCDKDPTRVLNVSRRRSCVCNHGDSRKELPPPSPATIGPVECLLAELLPAVGALVRCDKAAQTCSQSRRSRPIETLTGAGGSASRRLTVFVCFRYKKEDRRI